MKHATNGLPPIHHAATSTVATTSASNPNTSTTRTQTLRGPLWAVLDFRAARQRDRAQGTSYPSGTLAGTGITVVLGGVAWAAFAFWGHALLIGISPLGR